MGKPRSRQPAHARPVRRSLVELTAAAVSSAARDGERVTSPAPIATFFEDVKAGETAAERTDQLTTSITVAPPATGHAEASAVIQLPHPADALTSSARSRIPPMVPPKWLWRPLKIIGPLSCRI